MVKGTHGIGIPMVGGHLLLTKVQILSVLTIQIYTYIYVHLWVKYMYPTATLPKLIN